MVDETTTKSEANITERALVKVFVYEIGHYDDGYDGLNCKDYEHFLYDDVVSHPLKI